jgi:hypothetical protein
MLNLKNKLYKQIAMVEVFKTSVQKKSESCVVIEKLLEQFPDYTINFDLEDCDCILRIEHTVIENEKIIALLNSQGYYCETLF